MRLKSDPDQNEHQNKMFDFKLKTAFFKKVVRNNPYFAKKSLEKVAELLKIPLDSLGLNEKCGNASHKGRIQNKANSDIHKIKSIPF